MIKIDDIEYAMYDALNEFINETYTKKTELILEQFIEKVLDKMLGEIE